MSCFLSLILQSDLAEPPLFFAIRALPENEICRANRVRKKAPDSAVEQNLITFLETRTAGDPDQPDLVFTDLTPTQLEEKLHDLGTPACDDTIRDWMDEHHLRLRKIRKSLTGGHSPDRDPQFVNIAQLIEEYRESGNPYFSLDSKAKEFQGQLFRKGRVRSSQPFEAFDHDFPSWADGVIIPHGLYDPVRNRGHINIGLSRDTTEFACDSFRWYWNRIDQQCFPQATSILLLVDGGGSNSAREYLFKHDLQQDVRDRPKSDHDHD